MIEEKIANIERDKRGKFLPGNPTRIKPGQVLNPKGRPPKDVSLTSLLKEQLEQIPEHSKQGKTWRQLIVEAWMWGALKGNPILLRELVERIDGRVVQPIAALGEIVFVIGRGYENQV